MEVVVEIAEQPIVSCPNCGKGNTSLARTRSAFWQDEKLVVVEDIPALICEDCGDQFYDDNTVVILDLLRGDGFPEERARSELRVPVFSFNDRLRSDFPA